VRAAVLAEVNKPMQVEELLDPSPRIGEVLVQVSMCGVCHSDLHVMKGEVTFPLPAVLGHEISGVIVATGSGVLNVRAGDRVVSSFIIPCGLCPKCVRGEEDLCEAFGAMNRSRGVLYDGETRIYRRDSSPVWMYSMGGLAQLCAVPATAVFCVPDRLKLSDVATLGCSSLTAYGAVKNAAHLQPGDSVAVVGVGGVGSSIVQLASLFGASDIIAIDLSDEKLSAAVELGATQTVRAADADVRSQILDYTGGRGVDYAFEAFGSAKTFRTAADCVADGGCVVVVGIAPAGAQAELDISRIARRKLRVLGSYGARPRTDMPALLRLVSRNVLRPERIVSRRFDLESVNDAYRALAAGEILGRAVIDIGNADG